MMIQGTGKRSAQPRKPEVRTEPLWDGGEPLVIDGDWRLLSPLYVRLMSRHQLASYIVLEEK